MLEYRDQFGPFVDRHIFFLPCGYRMKRYAKQVAAIHTMAICVDYGLVVESDLDTSAMAVNLMGHGLVSAVTAPIVLVAAVAKF